MEALGDERPEGWQPPHRDLKETIIMLPILVALAIGIIALLVALIHQH